MTLLLDTCSTHMDCVCATYHLRKNEKPDTFASGNCTKDSLPHEFLGAAFSLIMIMLQASSYGSFWSLTFSRQKF